MSESGDRDAPLAATVLICSRERPQMLMETVESVLAGEAVPSELIVVDQSSTPHTGLDGHGMLRGSTVRYLHSSSSGLSRARNIGVRAARQEVVVLLDDDMLVEPDWLASLLDGFHRGGERTVATGRVLAAPVEGLARPVPAAALVTSTASTVYRGRQPSDVVPGANVAVRREVLLAIGGFDERLGPGTRYNAAEDNDMGLRLLDANCQVRHVPEAVVLHRAWRPRRDLVRLHWSYARGKGAFYAKHLSPSDSYIAKRLVSDLRTRVREGIGALPDAPATAAKELLSLAGILSGAFSWGLRETLTGRDRS